MTSSAGPDLTTNYLGLRLKNPLVAGASPMSREVGTVRALEDAGIAAVVVYSLFEEQIRHELEAHEHFEEWGTESYAEATSYFPRLDYFPRGPHEYVEHVGRIKEAVDIPVIASLNGTTPGGWVEYARMLQEAGADAIELNLYFVATDPAMDAAAVEQRYLDVLAAVRDQVSVPVAMKLSPFFSSLVHFARRLDGAGVDGLVLFNRFYQPDIDLEALEVKPDPALSAPHEMRLPLRWIAILDPVIDASLAASTGIYTHEDVLKLLMVGADVTMLCAVLLRNGPDVISRILNGMSLWMEEHEYLSVHQMQGSMNQRGYGDAGAFERAHYMKALLAYR
ncbi:MAG: dihydroorotate dehydrogenase-like protein [Planctomycetota bacterium]|nr:MAG: dihydroorotate dehydrogenase-like protein [Planctomycetota bacterium]